MVEKIRRYLKLLNFELDDLVEGLKLLEKISHERLEKHEITNYVFQENRGLLEVEISGVKRILKELGGFNAEDFETIDQIEAAIIKASDEWIKTDDLPESISLFIKRALDKVRKYLELI